MTDSPCYPVEDRGSCCVDNDEAAIAAAAVSNITISGCAGTISGCDDPFWETICCATCAEAAASNNSCVDNDDLAAWTAAAYWNTTISGCAGTSSFCSDDVDNPWPTICCATCAEPDCGATCPAEPTSCAEFAGMATGCASDCSTELLCGYMAMMPDAADGVCGEWDSWDSC